MELTAGGGAADMEAAAVAALGPLLGGASAPGSVSLAVSSSLNVFRAQKRYSTGLTIAELKCKLELVVGIPASLMDLQLFGVSEEPLGRLEQDEALLGSYPRERRLPPAREPCARVTDRSGSHVGVFEDVSQVPKYEIPDSEYDKRPGQTDFKPGYWVGVRYDEPLGKHDGSVGGRRYFECQPKYGAFVKPQSVTPGGLPRGGRWAGGRDVRGHGTRGGRWGHGGDAGGGSAGGGHGPQSLCFPIFLGCVCVPALSPPPQRCFHPQMSPNRVCVCPPNPPPGSPLGVALRGGRGLLGWTRPYQRDTPPALGRHLLLATLPALATPPLLRGGVASFAPQPMGGRAEEEAGPGGGAGSSGRAEPLPALPPPRLPGAPPPGGTGGSLPPHKMAF
ncbi:hypothetical protein Q9966_016021 [Columba livia]|nr:hypothetical protein Q9966_016021 [Columba livia]